MHTIRATAGAQRLQLSALRLPTAARGAVLSAVHAVRPATPTATADARVASGQVSSETRPAVAPRSAPRSARQRPDPEARDARPAGGAHRIRRSRLGRIQTRLNSFFFFFGLYLTLHATCQYCARVCLSVDTPLQLTSKDPHTLTKDKTICGQIVVGSGWT